LERVPSWKALGIFKLMREHILDGVESVTPSAELIYSVVLEHLNQMVEHYGEYGVVLFRKHLHTYSKGLKGASQFREVINSTKDVEILRREIESLFLADQKRKVYLLPLFRISINCSYK